MKEKKRKYRLKTSSYRERPASSTSFTSFTSFHSHPSPSFPSHPRIASSASIEFPSNSSNPSNPPRLLRIYLLFRTGIPRRKSLHRHQRNFDLLAHGGHEVLIKSIDATVMSPGSHSAKYTKEVQIGSGVLMQVPGGFWLGSRFGAARASCM